MLSGEVPPQGSGNRVLSVCGVGWALRQAQDVNPLRPVRQAQDVDPLARSISSGQTGSGCGGRIVRDVAVWRRSRHRVYK